jgi:Uncharacterized protein conserved in bacteria
MLTPGPDHPITLEPATSRWRAFFAGHVIADTDDALVLKEADLRPVVYFPRGDVSMDYFTRTDHVTHCPYKGDAAHYSLYMDGELVEKAAWSYEDPFEAVGPIEGRQVKGIHTVDAGAYSANAPSPAVDRHLAHWNCSITH